MMNSKEENVMKQLVEDNINFVGDIEYYRKAIDMTRTFMQNCDMHSKDLDVMSSVLSYVAEEFGKRLDVPLSNAIDELDDLCLRFSLQDELHAVKHKRVVLTK